MAENSTIKVIRFGPDGPSITDSDLEMIGRLPNLKVLAIDGQPITSRGLAKLQHSEQMLEFYAAGTNLDDSFAETLAAMTTLKKVRLSGTKIGDNVAATLANLPQLSEVDVSGCQNLSAAAVGHIASISKLTKLNLYDTPVDDAAVESLTTATGLKWLNLDKTSLTDDGIASLQSMSELEFLHLGSTAISDAAADGLSALTSLKTLIVTRTNMTKTGVDKIQTAIPGCEIQLQYEP